MLRQEKYIIEVFGIRMLDKTFLRKYDLEFDTLSVDLLDGLCSEEIMYSPFGHAILTEHAAKISGGLICCS